VRSIFHNKARRQASSSIINKYKGSSMEINKKDQQSLVRAIRRPVSMGYHHQPPEETSRYRQRRESFYEK
jgi:hypothetical protein